jgi:hypothetical protein
LPFAAQAGPAGVTVPGSPARFVTVDTGRATLLQRIARAGGRVEAWRTIRDRLAVPSVAMDGSAGGLSADGRTLVLVRPHLRFPVRRTQLALADPRTLHLRRFTLPGTFTFDAISPDGRWLYLVQYVDARDPGRYAVRRYDTRTRRLVPGAIVDRREPGEEMRGMAITRAGGADGRWAFTLYDGAGETPFIHALDTTGRRAFCIDLPRLRGHRDLYALRLAAGAGGLRVLDRGRPLVRVDTATMRVAPAARAGAAADGGGGAPWLVLVGAGLSLTAAGWGVAAVRRRGRVAA